MQPVNDLIWRDPWAASCGLSVFVLPAGLATQYAAALGTATTTRLDPAAWQVLCSLFAPYSPRQDQPCPMPAPAALAQQLDTAWAATH